MLQAVGTSVASAGVVSLPVNAGSVALAGGASVAAGHLAEAAAKANVNHHVAAEAGAFGKQVSQAQARPS